MTHPRVTLISRAGCHLCDEARSVIAAVTAELGEEFVEVDLGSDPGLAERYGEMIPVTLVDGRLHDYWRVSPARLTEALQTPL